MYELCINKEVEKELKENFHLYSLWRMKYNLIDSDIDPVHNPDWCEKQSEREVNRLAELKARLNDLKRLWDEEKNL